MQQSSCVRCQRVVDSDQTDFTADGLVCRTCIIASNTDPAKVTALTRELARSTARKHMIAGGVMTASGIAILALGLSGGELVIIPVGVLVAGIVELARGALGLPTDVR